MNASELRTLCITNNWFTHGTNAQYSKIFEENERINEHADVMTDEEKQGYIKRIATIIYICSDMDANEESDILSTLQEAYKPIVKIGIGFLVRAMQTAQFGHVEIMAVRGAIESGDWSKVQFVEDCYSEQFKD